MQYHEVRIVAELRKQGEHERAEEFRLKAMRRTRRRIPEHLVPLAGTPSDSPPGTRPGGSDAVPPVEDSLRPARQDAEDEPYRSPGHGPGSRADDTLGFRIARVV
jgi:hypothetical protein